MKHNYLVRCHHFLDGSLYFDARSIENCRENTVESLTNFARKPYCHIKSDAFTKIAAGELYMLTTEFEGLNKSQAESRKITLIEWFKGKGRVVLNQKIKK